MKKIFNGILAIFVALTFVFSSFAEMGYEVYAEEITEVTSEEISEDTECEISGGGRK